MYTKTTVSSEHVWIYIHPKGKRMRNGTGITIYILYKHYFAKTIQKPHWQNKFEDIGNATPMSKGLWIGHINSFIMLNKNYSVSTQHQ